MASTPEATVAVRPRLPSMSSKARLALESLSPSISSVAKGFFLGSYPAAVHEKSNYAGLVGDALAAMRLLHQPIKFVMSLNDSSLHVVDANTGAGLSSLTLPSIMHVITAAEVPHAGLNESDVVFMTEDAQNSIINFHAFEIKPKYFEPLRKTLREAKCGEELDPQHMATATGSTASLLSSPNPPTDAASTPASPEGNSTGGGRLARRKSKVQAQLEQQQSRAIREIFGALSIGAALVNSKHGDDVCQAAYTEVTKTQKAKRSTHSQVAIILAVDGLRVVNTGTDTIDLRALLKSVSYATILDEGKAIEVLALIVFNDRLDTLNCHLFACAKGVAARVCAVYAQVMEETTRANEGQQGQELSTPTTTLSVPPPVAVATLSEALKAVSIERSRLEIVKELGSGQFGTVYLVNVAKAANEDEDDSFDQCAVKKLRAAASPEDREAFHLEAEIMAQLVHPNLVRLVGVCMERTPWLVLLEVMQYGDLKAMLLACTQRNIFLKPGELWYYARQLSEGMAFMISKGFVHMDLAARNVLVHTNNLVKISDFGLTNAVDPATKFFQLKKAAKLAVRWLSAETLRPGGYKFSETTDVYAFGILLWEIATQGRLPFENLTPVECKREILAGRRLEAPDGCPKPLAEIMQRCWASDPAARPTFAALAQEFEKLQTESEASGPARRDIGALLNQMLTQNLRYASMRASVARKSMRLSAASVVTAAGRPSLPTVSED